MLEHGRRLRLGFGNHTCLTIGGGELDVSSKIVRIPRPSFLEPLDRYFILYQHPMGMPQNEFVQERIMRVEAPGLVQEAEGVCRSANEVQRIGQPGIRAGMIRVERQCML